MPMLFFKKLKETKGTVVFEQVNEDGTEVFSPSMKTIYVAKSSPLLNGGKTEAFSATFEIIEPIKS